MGRGTVDDDIPAWLEAANQQAILWVSDSIELLAERGRLWFRTLKWRDGVILWSDWYPTDHKSWRHCFKNAPERHTAHAVELLRRQRSAAAGQFAGG